MFGGNNAFSETKYTKYKMHTELTNHTQHQLQELP